MVHANSKETDHTPADIGDELVVSIENLGGIDSAKVTLIPGVTILAGENATNRTSFLRSLAAALGGRESAVSVKSDAESGTVELSTAGETFTRVISTTGPDPSRSAPFCNDESLVDTFVAIDERNPARRAIRSGGEGLRDLLMRPVDTESIETEIRELRAEREELEGSLDRIESRQSERPALERRRNEVQTELESIEDTIETLEEDIEEQHDGGPGTDAETRYAEQTRLREKLDEKRSVLERQREKIDELESKHAELEADLETIEVDESTLADIQAERERLEREKRDLENFTNDLAVVLDVNTDLLEGEYEEMAVETDVMAALDPASKTVECWTCGSDVRREEIRDRLDSLRALQREKQKRRDEIDERLAELADRASDIERDSRRREKLETDIADVEAELEFRSDRVTELAETIESIEAELETLQAEIESMAADRDSEDANAYRRLSELEYERGRLVEEASSLEADIEEIERLIEDERPAVESRIESVNEELETLRDRVASIERAVIETFDEHMNELLDRLHYRNVERVWLERRQANDSGAEESSEFLLHVVREDPDGTVYEDTVDTLSESERELIGIVIALAGYLVHDVADHVPFILLDSVEAIDAERLSTILEYVGEYAPFLLAAVLPEEAAALPAGYDRISASNLR